MGRWTGGYRIAAALLAVTFVAGLLYSYEIRDTLLEVDFFWVWAIGYLVLVLKHRRARPVPA